MVSPGKRFEEDFKKSAIQVMNLDRLKDPPQSFNSGCQGCPKLKTRFSPKNICDFIGYHFPNQYYLELKSNLGKSIPFDNIVKDTKDKRLSEMVQKQIDHVGVFSFVIFNWRDCDNETYMVPASFVQDFIAEADRKSIPVVWTRENGILIPSKLKRVRYSYDMGYFGDQ